MSKETRTSKTTWLVEISISLNQLEHNTPHHFLNCRTELFITKSPLHNSFPQLLFHHHYRQPPLPPSSSSSLPSPSFSSSAFSLVWLLLTRVPSGSFRFYFTVSCLSVSLHRSLLRSALPFLSLSFRSMPNHYSNIFINRKRESLALSHALAPIFSHSPTLYLLYSINIFQKVKQLNSLWHKWCFMWLTRKWFFFSFFEQMRPGYFNKAETPST